jgi:hypothetical protein
MPLNKYKIRDFKSKSNNLNEEKIEDTKRVNSRSLKIPRG